MKSIQSRINLVAFTALGKRTGMSFIPRIPRLLVQWRSQYNGSVELIDGRPVIYTPRGKVEKNVLEHLHLVLSVYDLSS